MKHILFKKQLLLLVLFYNQNMKDMESKGKRKCGRRFRKAVDGPGVMELYAWMTTAEVARRRGLTEKQVKNYVYSENMEDWASKDAAVRSRINSENGKKGGRPRKKLQ
jgi:hypothetical protein